jgi:mono/diheme cytochrome c family protein
MKPNLFYISIIFASFTATVAMASPRIPADGRNGRQLYQYWCGPCHARGMNKPGTASLTYKYKGVLPAALEDRTDLAPDAVRYFVRHGVSIMPFFRKTEIDDSALDKIANYLARTK